MSLASGLAVYVVVWWLVLFMVLPWGHRPIDAEDVSHGHAAGAPKRPRLLVKFAITTVIATLVFAGIHAAVSAGVISFRQ